MNSDSERVRDGGGNLSLTYNKMQLEREATFTPQAPSEQDNQKIVNQIERF